MIGFPVGISLDRQVLNSNLPLYQAKTAWLDIRIYPGCIKKMSCKKNWKRSIGKVEACEIFLMNSRKKASNQSKSPDGMQLIDYGVSVSNLGVLPDTTPQNHWGQSST